MVYVPGTTAGVANDTHPGDVFVGQLPRSRHDPPPIVVVGPGVVVEVATTALVLSRSSNIPPPMALRHESKV
jgi:hypothetical protein